jgi:hypothetical protein
MSQYGMQLPGKRARQAATINIYTGLLFAACLSLMAAAGFAWVQGSKLGPSDKGAMAALSLQDAGNIRLAPAR